MKKSLFIFTFFLVGVAISPALSQARGSSYFNQGQTIVKVNPYFLLSGGLQGGVEYYATNSLSAGLDIISWSWGSASNSYGVTGFSPYARYHFKHGKTVFKNNKVLRNGDFYGTGGFSSITYSGGGTDSNYSGPFVGGGYFFVYDKNWVIDFGFNLAIGTFNGWSPGGLGSGFGYAL